MVARLLCRRDGREPERRHQRLRQPVSYTHLRAHETVLDLVCRLLLEKKKQQLEEVGLQCITTNSTTVAQLRARATRQLRCVGY